MSLQRGQKTFRLKTGQHFVPSEILPQLCLDIIRDVNDGTAAKPSNLKIGVRFVPSDRAENTLRGFVNDLHVDDVNVVDVNVVNVNDVNAANTQNSKIGQQTLLLG